MRYLSVCSGIEAASCAWHPLGWEPFAFSEIEAFPSAVLAYHYPDVPNLGDMTRYQEWPDAAIDLLVGGTPCQSFSVAGLRKGLADPRGNLMLTFGAIAGRYRPTWLVWENVPGVLSNNGGRDFGTFLDMVESLGYIIDCDILDAQFHGVTQRRRRVFVCAQHRDFLLRNKTDSSALTIAQCLLEILHGILASQSAAFGSEPQNSDLAYLSSDGVMRRMRLFGLHGDHANFSLLQQNLAEACLRCHQEQRCSDASLGVSAKERTPEGQLKGLRMDDQSIPTVQQLNEALAESWEAMRSFTTSTGTNSTTQSEIFTFSKAALLIAQLIPHLNQSCPPFWSAASSGLIALEEFTNYARQASSDLFGDVERVPYWIHFIEQAESTIDALADIGIECFGEVFSIADSLQGHPAPRREAGKGIARPIAGGSQRGSRYRNDADTADNLVPMPHADISPAIKARDSKGVSSDGDGDGDGDGAILVPMIAPISIQGTMIGRGETAGPAGPGYTENGISFTLTKTDVHAIAFDTTQITSPANYSNPQAGDPCHPLEAGMHPPAIAFDCKASGRNGFGVGEIASTLRSMGHAGSHQNGGGHQAVAVSLRGREGGGTAELGDEVGQCLRASKGGGDKAHVLAPAADTLYNKGIVLLKEGNGSTQETYPGTLLRTLRQEVGEEAFAKWGLGILNSLQQAEVLRQALHGLSIRPASFSRSWVVYCALSRSESRTEWLLQSLREAGCERCASQGWEPSEQLAGELGAYLSELSRPGAQAARFLHDLWQASQGVGVLRQALSAVQEVWRPTSGEGKPALGGMQVRRLTVEECEFLQGFPRGYTLIPVRGKPAADGPRYKALGNSMAVPVMAWIGRRIAMVDSLANRDPGALVYPEKAA